MAEHGVPSRPCPICAEPLEHESFKGVPIEVCLEHGIWLDNGELEMILAKRERTLRARARRQANQAHRDGKVSGMLFGWWSLFVDR